MIAPVMAVNVMGSHLSQKTVPVGGLNHIHAPHFACAQVDHQLPCLDRCTATDDKGYSDHKKTGLRQYGNDEDGDEPGEEEEFTPAIVVKIRDPAEIVPATGERLREASLSLSAPPPPGGGGRRRGASIATSPGGGTSCLASPLGATPLEEARVASSLYAAAEGAKHASSEGATTSRSSKRPPRAPGCETPSLVPIATETQAVKSAVESASGKPLQSACPATLPPVSVRAANLKSCGTSLDHLIGGEFVRLTTNTVAHAHAKRC